MFNKFFLMSLWILRTYMQIIIIMKQNIRKILLYKQISAHAIMQAKVGQKVNF